MMLKCLMLYLTMVPIISEAQDCTLPSTSFLEIRLENLLAAKGGEGDSPIVTAQGTPHYTCQAQGTFMETYKELSVVMNYITVDSNPRIRQYELKCVTSGSEGWQETSGSLSNVYPGNFIDYVNLGTFTNCSECNENAGNDNHCVACHADCNDGLMRCTGQSSDECCVAFIPANEMCSPNFEFQCDGNPCGNNGTCHPSADGYTCICPEGFTGDNCNTTIIDSCIGSNCDSPVDSSPLNPLFNISVYHSCQSTCENETNEFNKDLCLFYCQLEEWREVANQSGLYIPEINDQSLNDMGHSLEERWQRALSYQKQYYDAWVEFSRNQGNVISTNNKEDEDPILVWRSEIISVQESLILWRKEALSINPNLEFGELTNITAIDFEDLSYEELSQIYADISQEWSRDLNTYTVNFSF